LYKMLDELDVSEITINLEKGSVTIK